MTNPLKSMTVTGAFGMRAVAGTGLPDKNGVKRHIGVDLRASVGTPVYAPEDGVVTLVDDVGLKLVEIRSAKYTHRFLHLSKNILKAGQKVKAGQLIGYSGNSGGVLAHLHWDIRLNGTAWNSSYYNYRDPMKLIKEEDMSDKEIRDMAGIVVRAYIGETISKRESDKFVRMFKSDGYTACIKWVKDWKRYKANLAKSPAGKLKAKNHLMYPLRKDYKEPPQDTYVKVNETLYRRK